MSRYASAGLSGSARSPRARREEASSRKRSRRSGSRPARARVAAIVLVAAIVTRRAARTVSSVRRRSRVTEGMVQQSSEVASGAGPRPLPDPGVDLALLLRRRALHVLPRHRPHLPPHRARHHQGRALPPRAAAADLHAAVVPRPHAAHGAAGGRAAGGRPPAAPWAACGRDRKSTRLNSSHSQISYAVFCLKKKKEIHSANVI